MSHTGKKLCLTVTAFITYKNKVLLIYHNEYKGWFPPGGHIEKEEDPETAVYREIEEETGFTKSDIEPIIPHPKIERDLFSDMEGKNILSPNYSDLHRAGTNFHVAFRFFFKSKRREIVSTDEDIDKMKWFSSSELEKEKYKLREHVRFYGLKALELSKA